MEQLHKDLLERHPLYVAYHRIPFVTLLNFSILIAVASFTASSLVGVVSTQSQLATVVAADITAPIPPPTIQELNAQIREAAKQFANASGDEKAVLQNVLLTLVNARKELVLDTAKKNPQEVLGVGLPVNVVKQLPDEAQAQIERIIDVDGTMTVLHIDDFAGRHETPLEYYMTSSASGKKYHVNFAGDHPDVITGAKVHVHGPALESEIIAGASGGSFTVASAGTTAAGGKTIFILANFSDKVETRLTPAQVYADAFTSATSTNEYYYENSYNAVTFSGDVVGWFTMNYPVASCTSSGIAYAAEAAATAAGVNLSGYSHKVYIIPLNSCANALGSVGGNPSLAWVASDNIPPVGKSNSALNHELGHNLGVHHANSFDCSPVQMSAYTNCVNGEYGDISDVMGSTNHSPQFNAPHKIAEGWLNSGSVQTITTSGIYSVAPIENSTGVRALKIAKPNTSDAYYISYRQNESFFDSVQTFALTGPNSYYYSLEPYFTNGVSIHVWNGVASVQSKLVDTTPGDSIHYNSALRDGATFGDPVNGIKITQLSHSASSATVQVQFGTYVDTSAPNVSISSPVADAALSNQVSIVSQAGDDVGVTKVELYKDGILLGADTTAPYAFAWDTTLEAASSTHSLQARAYDAAGNIGSSTIVPVYVDNIPPTISITAPLNGATVSGSASIYASGADNYGVRSISMNVDGFSIGTATWGCLKAVSQPYNWKSASSTDGIHTIQATIKDCAGSVSASSVITVTSNNGTVDTTPPKTAITAPLNGSSITASSAIWITANSTDENGVAKVEFLRDGSVICSVDNPYAYVQLSCSWDTSADARGSHTLQTRAYDKSGNTGLSSPITVNLGSTADTQAPSVPQNLSGTAISQSQINLSWAASTDNLGVSGYNVYRDGTKIGTPTGTSYYSTGLAAGTSYSFSVAAFDAAGNTSAQSTVINVSTTQVITDTTPPTVSITSPANGTVVKGNTSVKVAVSATDANGIASIKIFADEVQVASCLSTTICSTSWQGKNITTGTHTLRALATDRAGNTNNATVTITK